jgi:hypothetical protein
MNRSLDDAFGLQAPDFTTHLPVLGTRQEDQLDPLVASVMDRLPEIYSPTERIAYGRERLCDLLYQAPTPLAFLQTTQAMQIVERHAEVVLSPGAARPRRPASFLDFIGESIALAVLSLIP